ncbi:MAG TPA: glycosyl transferase [Alphaproteobacteria bacterium]
MIFLPFIYLGIGFILSVSLVRLVIPILHRMEILDTTESRVQTCVHEPTPRGGGWGVTPVIAILWLTIWYYFPDKSYWHALIASLLLFIPLTGITWLDDKHDGITVRKRMWIQGIAIIIPIIFLPSDVMVCLGYLPLWLDRIVTILGWWWFMNLFNFMDGINGISGLEIATIGLGIALCAYFNEHDFPLTLMGMVLLGAAAGWLVWNWRRNALAFLGDVGSIGLGYFGGFALIILASKGHFWPAALMSLYYCMDATVTLIYKIKRGVPVWQSERAHFYHKGTVPGALTSLQATMRLLVLNIILLVMAFCASRYERGWAYLPFAMALCVLLMCHFRTEGKKALSKNNNV